MSSAVRAVLLAAGRGTRLRELGRERPKCLLEFQGRTLLRRHLDSLRQIGVADVTVAVGYRADQIEAELGSAASELRAQVIFNPDFERGSVVTLSRVRDALEGNDDVLLMDADVLYDPVVLTRLAKASGNLFLLDRSDCADDAEAVKLCVRGSRIVEFRKSPRADLAFDFMGESVGFFRFTSPVARALAQRSSEYVASGRTGEPYEEAIRDLLLADPALFSFVDVTGLPWIEIDSPEDLEQARTRVLPRIRGDSERAASRVATA